MRDITSIIMGDPGTHPRRAPTEREMAEWKQLTSHEQNKAPPKRSLVDEWEVGEGRWFETWRKAKNAQSTFYIRGLVASIKRNEDGSYTVTRLR